MSPRTGRPKIGNEKLDVDVKVRFERKANPVLQRAWYNQNRSDTSGSSSADICRRKKISCCSATNDTTAYRFERTGMPNLKSIIHQNGVPVKYLKGICYGKQNHRGHDTECISKG